MLTLSARQATACSFPFAAAVTQRGGRAMLQGSCRGCSLPIEVIQGTADGVAGKSVHRRGLLLRGFEVQAENPLPWMLGFPSASRVPESTPFYTINSIKYRHQLTGNKKVPMATKNRHRRKNASNAVSRQHKRRTQLRKCGSEWKEDIQACRQRRQDIPPFSTLSWPQGRGEAARNLLLVEGHVGEVDEILLDFELKGAGLLSERHKVEERSEEAFCRASWLVPRMGWVPWATLNCSTKPDPGAAHILLALPLFLVALISSPLPWPSDLPGWRKQSDCLE
ncbi:hypothetical protein Anapl_08001 [Anas platyrhynchos]|uniref:Uncharacterized protein n=1 Tax=Anas platyrhynchos TaxID=8839 RepID=R0M6Z9_ANAPL|nr:hypothetical protein Anapl_08001 [Anas platyrhynchos]